MKNEEVTATLIGLRAQIDALNALVLALLQLLLLHQADLLLLVAFVYGLWATAWIEHERVEGLYGFGVPALRPRTSGRA